jgi:polysaccharide export outer membrane protein
MKNLIIGLLTLSLALSSCTTPKNITYMQGFDDNATQAVAQQKRITVKPDDKLSIIVSCKDPELAESFNLVYAQPTLGGSTSSAGGRSSGGARNGQTAAYTVDPNGNIQFPILGEIHIAGLQRAEVAEKIKDMLVSTNMLKSPVVTVEFLNASIYVLGDVSSPGEYSIDKESLNIVQAISLAGDLNITGQRENVLVVREENGQNHAYRVDLTNKASLLQSPVYYLQQNDLVYVEPNNMKKRDSENNANTFMTPTFWMSVISFLTSLGVLIFN